MTVRLLIGDCRERLAEIEAGSVDSCVTDPPYHLTSIHKRFAKCGGASRQAPKKDHQYRRLSRGFMGQQWDGGDVAFQRATWEAVFRVLKPGAHLIAFSGTRTYHRMVCAIEDAGFEIRDQLAWIYGSGFPKSHNQPGGWGTALKPAWEPICLARKPLDGTVAANMAAHGTGGLNVNGCRIETTAADARDVGRQINRNVRGGVHDYGMNRHGADVVQSVVPAEGRWPANILHDGSEEVLAGFPDAPGQLRSTGPEFERNASVYGTFAGVTPADPRGDSGSAARFFYCAKATSAERGEGNGHPTVKPVDLMRWLVRLVTPKGGTVLDPFCGSGSTLIAADAEQFHAIGCELSPEYAVIAERRMKASAGMFADLSCDSVRLPEGEAGTAECEASQSGPNEDSGIAQTIGKAA